MYLAGVKLTTVPSGKVGDALIRYINQGSTIGSVNLPEVNLRSLTLDEPKHARVRTVAARLPLLQVYGC